MTTKYQGLIIKQDADGFYTENGSDCIGYCETLEEIKSAIDDYWQGTEHGEANGYFNE